jgi:hypothetical protein
MQIGKVFRESGRGDTKAFSNAKEKLQKDIPEYNRQFHAQLDEVEVVMVGVPCL